MDLSQLPKMSETPKPPPVAIESDIASPRPQAAYVVPPAAYVAPQGGAMGVVSVWISLLVGVIFLSFGKRFGDWLFATLRGRPFDTTVHWLSGPSEGQLVSYFELDGRPAWSEAGFFTMGVALLLDAALLFLVYRSAVPRRGLVLTALAITGLAMAINLGVVGYLFTANVLPIASLVAMLSGGIMLFDQMALLRESR